MNTIPKPATKAQLLAHLRCIHALFNDPKHSQTEEWRLLQSIEYHVNEALEPGRNDREFAGYAAAKAAK
jgi:hypothetical protein